MAMIQPEMKPQLQNLALWLPPLPFSAADYSRATHCGSVRPLIDSGSDKKRVELFIPSEF
jgi:hypothetical protein